MTSSSWFRIALVAVICLALAATVSAQSLAGSVGPRTDSFLATSSPTATDIQYEQPVLVGTYLADGSYRAAGSDARYSTVSGEYSEPNQAAVPGKFRLHSNETVVENFAPPLRASNPVGGHSIFGSVFDNLVTFAYGREKVLRGPTHVATDSTGRMIVTDPELKAIHVLDASGKQSFRIAGGPQRRLQSPAGVAVDRDDNIYVADKELGLISVYDPRGKFLRYVGNVQSESLFDTPTGIAIDKTRGRLYVLDTTADEIIAMDLQGNVLKRIGGDRGRSTVNLKHPSEIAVWNDEVIVLDRFGSRIAIFSPDYKLVNSFDVRSTNAPPIFGEVGLALDNESNIYLSNMLSSSVRIYRHDGRFLGYLGRESSRARDFNAPSGLWIDSSDRLFVADTRNSRVEVFNVAPGRRLVADIPVPGAR